ILNLRRVRGAGSLLSAVKNDVQPRSRHPTPGYSWEDPCLSKPSKSAEDCFGLSPHSVGKVGAVTVREVVVVLIEQELVIACFCSKATTFGRRPVEYIVLEAGGGCFYTSAQRLALSKDQRRLNLLAPNFWTRHAATGLRLSYLNSLVQVWPRLQA